ncbi:hypothetical protein [Streptomyces klenkii]|uniref:hypothetical protein n=1 Tax=Streptomyces klenkii TaxID=1420899 RepID=UPI00343A91DE
MDLDETAASYGDDVAEEILAEFWDEAVEAAPTLREIQTVKCDAQPGSPCRSRGGAVASASTPAASPWPP